MSSIFRYLNCATVKDVKRTSKIRKNKNTTPEKYGSLGRKRNPSAPDLPYRQMPVLNINHQLSVDQAQLDEIADEVGEKELKEGKRDSLYPTLPSNQSWNNKLDSLNSNFSFEINPNKNFWNINGYKSTVNNCLSLDNFTEYIEVFHFLFKVQRLDVMMVLFFQIS